MRAVVILVYSALVVTLQACTHVTHVALVLIKNETNSIVSVESKISTQSGFKFLFRLKPKEDDILYKYEEKTEEEERIFTNMKDIRVTDNSNCSIILDSKALRQLATRRTDTSKWVIEVTPLAFSERNCSNSTPN